ncbi:MAG: LCP family protein [Candidatus Berkelbacteria bacterium]|nr:LCP family protein [Candidatus Berkelbacteria bacterium]
MNFIGLKKGKGEQSAVGGEVTSKPKKSRKKLWIVLAIIFALILLGAGAIYAYYRGVFSKNYSGSSPFLKMLAGDKNVALKGEGDGRINILLLGYGGANHPGGNLTDTIQVLSINPQDNTAAMLSIPRDLYVTMKTPSFGGKINEVYDVGNKQTKNGGGDLIKQEVGTILDLPIHYFVAVDFSGFKKAIDAVGGIDVTVDKDLYDPLYPADDMIHYAPFKITAGEHHMDGTTALKYARSRETTSDFDRSLRQQKVLAAFKSKVMSSGTLDNPTKVIALVNVLGSSVKTDLSLDEIKSLATIVKKIDTTKIVSKVLDNSATGPLVSDSSSGTFYLKTKTGNWKDVQKIAHEIFSDPYLQREAANVEIVNASKIVSAGNDLASTLKSYGYNIVDVQVAKTSQATTQIIDYSAGAKKYTLQFLAKRLNATVSQKTKPTDSMFDLQIILGTDNKEVYAKGQSL